MKHMVADRKNFDYFFLFEYICANRTIFQSVFVNFWLPMMLSDLFEKFFEFINSMTHILIVSLLEISPLLLAFLTVCIQVIMNFQRKYFFIDVFLANQLYICMRTFATHVSQLYVDCDLVPSYYLRRTAQVKFLLVLLTCFLMLVYFLFFLHFLLLPGISLIALVGLKLHLYLSVELSMTSCS